MPGSVSGRTRGYSACSIWRLRMATLPWPLPRTITTTGDRSPLFGPLIRTATLTRPVTRSGHRCARLPRPGLLSGHSIEGGAAAEVLKQFFGTDHISFQDCGVTLPAGSTCSDPSPVLRSYTSFSQAADENAYSRILVGFHFRKLVEEGTDYGRKSASVPQISTCGLCTE